MTKIKRYIALIVIAAALYSCDSHTYEELEDPMVVVGNVTYDRNIKVIIDDNCIVCHSPGGVSSFRPLTTYVEVRNAVLTTNLLERIQLPDSDPSQMPQPGRMPQNKIDLILQWNEDGLLEN
jgi:hypothetical protein